VWNNLWASVAPWTERKEMVQYSSREGRRGQAKWKTYELVINPTKNSLHRCTQHLMQPNVSIIGSLRNHLWIHHRFPFQHLSDSPLPTDVLPQSVGIKGVRGDVRVIGAGVDVWTRMEEHQEVGFEDSTA